MADKNEAPIVRSVDKPGSATVTTTQSDGTKETKTIR